MQCFALNIFTITATFLSGILEIKQVTKFNFRCQLDVKKSRNKTENIYKEPNWRKLKKNLAIIYTVTRKSFERIANCRIFQILHDR